MKVLPSGMGIREANALSDNVSTLPASDPPSILPQPFTRSSVGSVANRVFFGSLARINARTGKADWIADRCDCLWFGISADGAFVSYFRVVDNEVEWRPGSRRYSRLYEIHVVDLYTRRDKLLLTLPLDLPAQVAAWSPSGHTLAVISADNDLYRIDAASSSYARITGPSELSLVRAYSPPMWTGTDLVLLAEDGSFFLATSAFKKLERISLGALSGLVGIVNNWSANEARSKHTLPITDQQGYALFASPDSSTEGLARFNLASGTWKIITTRDWKIDGISLARVIDAESVAIVTETYHSPQQVDIIRLDGTITESYAAAPSSSEAVGGRRDLSWSWDGRVLHGVIFLPATTVAKPPFRAIVYPYPNERRSLWRNYYGGTGTGGTENLWFWTSRGYAVFLPDSVMLPRKQSASLVGSIGSGVQALIATELVDPHRIGIMGHSAGGYAAWSLLTQTSFFRAGVLRAGIANLITSAGTMAVDGSPAEPVVTTGGMYDCGGSPSTAVECFLENSPFFLFAKITAPVLIVQGTADLVRPNNDEAYLELRRLGKDVTYIRYPDEGHGEYRYTPRDAEDYLNRVATFFDKALK
jgi:dienelactone hydrolase